MDVSSETGYKSNKAITTGNRKVINTTESKSNLRSIANV